MEMTRICSATCECCVKTTGGYDPTHDFVAEKGFVYKSRGKANPRSLRCKRTGDSGKSVVCPSAFRYKRETPEARIKSALASAYVAVT